MATAGLLGRAGVSRTIGRRVLFRPLNSADRRSLAAVRLRGVVGCSMLPPDRILVPNRIRLPELSSFRSGRVRPRPGSYA
jgi:hypothetical protein